MNSRNRVHGMDPLPWDHWLLPSWFWKRLTVCVDTGCWEYNGAKDQNPSRIVAMRVLGVTKDDLYSVTRTCANKKCARPDHICVILR